jgi:hypothetical protein
MTSQPAPAVPYSANHSTSVSCQRMWSSHIVQAVTSLLLGAQLVLEVSQHAMALACEQQQQQTLASPSSLHVVQVLLSVRRALHWRRAL